MAIALGTRDVPASRITAIEAASAPVVNAADELVGMIGVNDLILAARPLDGREPELDDEQVIETMRKICAHASTQVLAMTAAT